jgi:hypothetical protein
MLRYAQNLEGFTTEQQASRLTCKWANKACSTAPAARRVPPASDQSPLARIKGSFDTSAASANRQRGKSLFRKNSSGLSPGLFAIKRAALPGQAGTVHQRTAALARAK